MKYWSCCRRKTSDFNTFLAQEGCTKGRHMWTKKDAVSNITLPKIAHWVYIHLSHFLKILNYSVLDFFKKVFFFHHRALIWLQNKMNMSEAASALPFEQNSHRLFWCKLVGFCEIFKPDKIEAFLSFLIDKISSMASSCFLFFKNYFSMNLVMLKHLDLIILLAT